MIKSLRLLKTFPLMKFRSFRVNKRKRACEKCFVRAMVESTESCKRFPFNRSTFITSKSIQYALLNTFPLLVLMSSIYLIDVVIDLSENCERKRHKSGEEKKMLSFHFQPEQVIFYQFSSMSGKRLFMVGNFWPEK